jgi:hypothetical protein
MRVLLWTSALFLCCCGDVLGIQEDPQELLLKVRRNVMETVERLPKYMCTETIDRSRFRTDLNRHVSGCDEPATGGFKPVLHLVSSDRLRLDVAISPLREIYSWAGANRFDDRGLLDIVTEGAVSTGEFGGYLSSLFGTDAATFTYQGDTKDKNGRVVAEFGFRVPPEKSQNEFGNRKFRIITGYDGVIAVDPETAQLLRVSVRAGRLPEETGACSATTTLDYGRVEMNGYRFLLPSEARLRLAMRNGYENENRAVYSGCHEFRAESTVDFDPPVNSTGGDRLGIQRPAPGPATLRTPGVRAGLPFRLKLAQDIDPRKDAAGDPVLAVLSSSIGSEKTGDRIPAGAAIHGRIVRVQYNFGIQTSVTVAIRLESIEWQGRTRPFSGRGRPAVQRFNAGSASFTRQRVALGSLGAMQSGTGQLFQMNAKQNFVFRKGTEMEWLTVTPQDSDGS